MFIFQSFRLRINPDKHWDLRNKRISRNALTIQDIIKIDITNIVKISV